MADVICGWKGPKFSPHPEHHFKAGHEMDSEKNFHFMVKTHDICIWRIPVCNCSFIQLNTNKTDM